MYTVTFYSFKGGVGRTMALSNVAFELARQGQRVLVVDFDLEAPSLGAFGLTLGQSGSRRPAPGIVEYVLDYLRTGDLPVVTDFVREIREAGDAGGRLWLMTAGRADAEYPAKLAQISWTKLYEENDGYVLFEALKAQWQDAYDPDYVLIDSRTGYTDVAGICTRQLPDAVVGMFYPNRQNLRGLQHVVDSIRAEVESPRAKRIEMHFVMANVPNLDDEEDILATRRREFRKALGIKAGPLTIRHYDSLAVLTTAVFTQERPKSRLAREYRRLAEEIRQRNTADVGGALQWLDQAGQFLLDESSVENPNQLERRLEEIMAKHGSDGAVLTSVARIRIRQTRLEEAKALLEMALAQGHSRPRVYLLLAEVRQRTGDNRGAADAAGLVLMRHDAALSDITRAIQIFRLSVPSRLNGISRTPAIATLSGGDSLWLAEVLAQSSVELTEAYNILERAISRSETLTEDERDVNIPSLQDALLLCLIGLRRFEEGEKLSRKLLQEFRPTLPRIFNHAMADWGNKGNYDSQQFEDAWKAFDSIDVGRQDANYFQCRALTAFVTARRDDSEASIDAARTAIARSAPQFSCWRYLRLTPSAFRADIDEMEQWIRGSGPGPVIFRNTLSVDTERTTPAVP